MGSPAVRVVLQSRLSSSRLPGKALLSIAGMPMVVLAALRAGNTGREVVVATSTAGEDDLIARAARAGGVAVVRGPLEDPLARFVIAAEGLADADVVVRLTADNVVPDGHLVDTLVEALGESGRSYARLGGDDPTVPYGVSAEAFTVRALREADAASQEAFDREHVTPRIRAIHGDHRIELPGLEPTWAGLRCTVDTFDDVVTVGRLFSDVPEPVERGWRDLCAALSALAPAPPARTVTRANRIDQGPVVLGTVQLGVSYGAANTVGQPSASEAADILSCARREGITHLDTARAYGDSEKRIGAALRRGLSEHVGIVTKIAPLEGVVGDDAPAAVGALAVHASVSESLRALGTDSVDALLLHRAADWHRPGVRDALHEVRSAGTTRMVGVSVGSPEELLDVLGDDLCEYVQLPFNLVDRRWLANDVQAALSARSDVVVTVRSVYLQGLLAVGDGARWPQVEDDTEALTRTLRSLAQALGRESLADLALAYVLGQPWVTSVVVGAETVEQLRETTALVSRPPLSAAELEQVHRMVAPGSSVLVDPSRWTWEGAVQ